ncbi:hypothetical protein PanWU01x14_259610 [Parasponia andersonii]|uniref:Neprosin PEP catalytic domain-containing protein n=1 Tax=Parasponia andersonii TaxID=3476 RepID=A0A2P5B978_PARAD|nr:hypothetical protein PanWU01x14_259610 [Parasponia andersonii]
MSGQGFVQVDRKITPTSPVGPASNFNGNQFDLKIQDRGSENWWFVVSDGSKDIPVGYWPKKVFPYGTQEVAWGGIAQAGRNKISPAMGNGHFPDGNYRQACYISDVHYVDHKNKMVAPVTAYTLQHVDKPKCYGLKNDRLMGPKNFGYSFTFGGSGGKCG